MKIEDVLRKIELFNGLSDQELKLVEMICKEKRFTPGEVIVSQGEYTDELYVITQGFVEVHLGKPSNKIKDLVTLGEGQITGEMSLVDQGPRSATVAAGTEPTTVQIIDRKDLETICLETPSIGYIIMRNIAIDLAFKLRHRNINEGGDYDDL